MELFFKIAAVSAMAAALSAVIKKDSPAMAMTIGLAALVAILVPALKLILEAADFLQELASFSGMAPVSVAVLLKVLGIAILSRAASDMLKEAGLASGASAVEMAGSAGACLAAMPLMKAVFQMIEGLL